MSKNLDRDFSLKEWVTNRAANSPEVMEDETVLRVQNTRELRMQSESMKKEPIEEAADQEDNHAKVTARITNATGVMAAPAQQIQIVRLLRDLGDRLRQSEKEREILWRELDSCRKLLTDIEDKTNNTEKAFLSIEHKMNSLPEHDQEEAKEFQKQIEGKISALETTTGSAVLRLEDAISENAKLSRRLEEVTQDRTLLLRKMEEMEETLSQTQDTLKAKALVLLTDHALASRTSLPQTPAWSGNDTLRTQENAGVNTSTTETILAQHKPWYKTTTRLNMNTGIVVALAALGIIGGWALSKTGMPAFPFVKTQTQSVLDAPAAPAETSARTQDDLMGEIATLANQIEPGDNAATTEAGTANAEENARSLEIAALTSFDASKEEGALASRMKADGSLPSVVKAIETKAYDGNKDAQHDLAAIYTAGHAGVKTDYEKASFWFTEAAHNGVANAQYNLAVLYHQGLGVKQDTNKAIELYRVAASNNHPEAQYNLGIAHIEGIGADYNPEIAAYYFRKAAEGGVVEAAYNMGLIEENGLLGEAQPEQAVFWYGLAKDHGNKQASEALDQLARQMDFSQSQLGKIYKKIADENPSYLKNMAKDGAAPAPAAILEKPEAAQSTAASVPVDAPRFDPVIVAQIQEQLIRLGLFSGSPDGATNDATRDAVQSYQSMNKLKADGRPTEDVLVHMLASEMQAPAAGAQ